MSQKWEYKQLDMSDRFTQQWTVEEQLKKYGDEGWEAYAITQKDGQPVYHFKRPIAVDPPPIGGRLPAPVDPPPIGGKQGTT
jgi:hypothetical protein